MSECISLHIGQAGVQLASAVWELFCAEHNLTPSGFPSQGYDNVVDCKFNTFFQEIRSQRYLSRSIMLDLDPTPIDEIRNGRYMELFHPDNLISGQEDASNNFARGCFTLGGPIANRTAERVRKSLEVADRPDCILIFRSLTGGTGSGVTSALFEHLADYSKITRIEIPIYPSPSLAVSTVEPYNGILCEHFCMEDVDLSLFFDNEAIYGICEKYLSMEVPTFTHLNRMIAQVTSTLTCAKRFENTLSNDFDSMQVNLVPYPRIHFPIVNFSPLISNNRGNHENLSTAKITRYLYEPDNQMVKCSTAHGRLMSCSVIYRGEVTPQDIYKAISELRSQPNLINFVEWCPTGFKIGLVNQPSTQMPGSLITTSNRDAAMVTNTTAISEVIHKLTQKFSILYSKRSFVHWFIGDGLEEVEFSEALYNIATLVNDYEEAALDLPKDNETVIENENEVQNENENESNFLEVN